jgi:parvulin-like peptidyl-prolyl isomerase
MRGCKRERCRLVFLVLSICLAIQCGKTEKEIEPGVYDLNKPDKQNSVILKIEDSFYLNSDFEQYVSLTADDNLWTSSIILSRLFDSFIEEKILLQDVKNRNISLSDNEIKQYITSLSRQLGSENGNTTDEVGSKILFEILLINKFTTELTKDMNVIPEEIDDYYEKNKREFLKPEMIKVSQILLDAEDEAVSVLKKVKDAPKELFGETARLVSVGLEAKSNGEMGIFELGQLPHKMEKIIFALKVGEVSQVMESSYGFHIFRLDDKYPAELLSKEDIASEIKVKIFDNKVRDFMGKYIKDLKSKMEWSFYPKELPFPYQRNDNE